MAVERAERRIPLDPRPNFTVIPGGYMEMPPPAVTTFEQEALANAGINSLQDIPKKDFIVVRAILAMDAFDFPERLMITQKEKRSMLGYYFFTAKLDMKHNYAYIRTYMDEGKNKQPEEITPEQLHKSVDKKIGELLAPMWESNRLIKAYNEFGRFVRCVYKVNPQLKTNRVGKLRTVTNEVAAFKAEWLDDNEIIAFYNTLNLVLPSESHYTWGAQRGLIVKEVMRLQEKGLSDKQIVADRKGILERTSYRQTVFVPHAEPVEPVLQIKKQKKEEEKFFSLHPEAYTVLDLKNLKVKHDEIATRLGKSIWEVQELVKGLNFFGKTQPHPSSEERVAKETVFLRQILDLRNNNKDNKEIAEELGVPIKRVYNGASLLIWMGLIEPLDKKEVRAKIIDNKVFYLGQLSRYLKSHHLKGISTIKMLHEKFCAFFPEAKISYTTFVAYYHKVEVRKKVPPSRLTYRQEVRQCMVDVISRIRATEGNVIIKIKDICTELSISSAFGSDIFSSIENTGPSNTNKWREQGRQRFIEIVKEIALTGEDIEDINVSQICREIGITPSYGLQIHQNLRKEMNLPPLRIHKQKNSQTVVFEASLA